MFKLSCIGSYNVFVGFNPVSLQEITYSATRVKKSCPSYLFAY